MKKIFSSIILLFLSLAACSSSTQDEKEKIVTFRAEVVEYKSMAMHFDYVDGTAEWKDAILLKVISPPDWKGKDLRILCAQEPQNSPWRKVGNVYEFSLAKKYLIGSYPEEDTQYVAGLGDIRGEVKLMKEAKQ